MHDKQMKNLLVNTSEITKITNRISDTIGKTLLSMVEPLQAIFKQVSNMMATEFMSGLSNALKNFANDIENAKNNPNSYFNYMKYQEDLDNMHWAWPYEINADELKVLLETANTEKEFDGLMNRFFRKEKIDKMVQEIFINVPTRHKMMLKQAKNAFDRGDYAIANNALMSIIDNMLSEYLVNKGQNKRVGILQPIIKYYEEFPLNEVDFIFELCMLSNNINFIFQDYRFNEKIEITTNKKVRRHTSLHGVKYSNKKVDALLLLNTLANFCKHQPLLDGFRNSLKIDKKEFVFSEKMKKKLEEKKCSDVILSVIQLDGKAEYKTIFKAVENIISDDNENKGKYLSRLLQKLKKRENIVCQIINEKRYWTIC